MLRPLPSAFLQIVGQIVALAIAALAACSHPPPPPPPGPPLPAEPDLDVGSMDVECKGLEAAIATYGECPNADDAERSWARSLGEYAEQTFAAGQKSTEDKEALHAMAVACRKAATSVQNATTRCHAGKKPRVDD